MAKKLHPTLPTYNLRCPTTNPESPQSSGQRWEITDEKKNQWVSLEFSADHFSKCYHYAVSFVILIVAIFFFNFKLSDSAEITHSKKALFFFFLFWSKSGLGFLRRRSFFRFLWKIAFIKYLEKGENLGYQIPKPSYKVGSLLVIMITSYMMNVFSSFQRLLRSIIELETFRAARGCKCHPRMWGDRPWNDSSNNSSTNLLCSVWRISLSC